MICPNCKARLKACRPLAASSRLRCPKCNTFLVIKKTEPESVNQDLVLQITKKGIVTGYKGFLQNSLIASTGDIAGRTISDIMTPDIVQPVVHRLNKAFQNGALQSFEHHHLLSDNYYELKCIVSGRDTALLIITNISEFRKAAAKSNYLAHHDVLTGLPNRYLFNDRLKQAISYAERDNKMLAILFLDLDNFKQVNDSIGHKAGDQLLRSVSDRLLKCLRATDSVTHITKEDAPSLVARLGGDEFTVLLNTISSVQEPAIVVNRIIKTLSEPFMIGAHEVFVTASIGIAVYPFDGKEIDTLLINADVAMYHAKNQGRNSYQYYSESMNKFAFERFTTENKLRKALDHNEFMLFYQPQIDIHNKTLIGVEALIRWLQPDLVLTRPSEFIPLAEQSGLIVEMGNWVLRTACEQSRQWQKSGFQPMRMTVNVSSIQFRKDSFVESVSEILSDTGVNPRNLQLELTESTIMHHSEDSISKLRALHAMGVEISVDDFGTGYSSLKYLKHFPLSALKIDTSFVNELTTSPTDQAIVKAIITLARNFNLKVVAEGVETMEQLHYLRDCGCDFVQGYVICPPVNSVALAQFTKKKKFF